MKERLKQLRKVLGLNQKAFGEPLNISRSTVGNYELGERILTDRTISDICRVYNVNEEWLRNGNGEMFAIGKSLDAELSALVAELISSNDDWVKNCIVKFLKLSPQSKEILRSFINSIADDKADCREQLIAEDIAATEKIVEKIDGNMIRQTKGTE